MEALGIVIGTRPEIIKTSPVLRELEEQDEEYQLIYTGQHYSDNLKTKFFNELKLREPDYTIENTGDYNGGKRLSHLVDKISEVIREEEIEKILVQGDTDSTLAGFLAGQKEDCTVGHIEAGIRSGNMEMPEEVNRRMIDTAAERLYAPTQQAKKNLQDEKTPGKIMVTGNTAVDATLQNSKISDEKSSVLEDIGLKEDNYGILTLHRESNVEDGETLGMLIEGVEHFAESEGIEIIFPCHPRTKEKLQNLKIETAKINLISPLGYLDFLKLQKNTAIMLTDSGGIQEECTVLKTPCVTLREETERPESIEEGFNILAGPEPEDILEKSRQMIYKEIKKDSPYGDGKACKRILIDLLN